MVDGVKGEGARVLVPPCRGDGRSLTRKLYNTMRSMENRVGGGEGIEGIYGSITESGVTKIMDALVKYGGMGEQSTLLDVGSGLGRPLLHALVVQGVKSVWGIEVDPVKCQKAEVFVKKTLEIVSEKEGFAVEGASQPKLECCSIEKVRSLSPATHVYTFWEGIPTGAKEALGELFSTSGTCQAIAIVQRAVRNKDVLFYLDQFGFSDVCVATSFPVAMSGSGRTFRAYVICKNGACGEASRQPSAGPPEEVEERAQLVVSRPMMEKKSRAAGRKTGRVQASIPFTKIKKRPRSRQRKA
ncbi:hypothetical protein HOP50_06g42060 [Chloropicon primus]|nr:hypothetical protein HOP50_06g42060 [Chloropicon primus]